MSVFSNDDLCTFAGFEISDIGDAVGDAGKWVGNAADTAASVVGDIGENVGKLAIAPYTLVDKIASGVPIDKALGRTLEEQVKAIHDIAPYAQIVISVVPGIGPVASGAISAGLALAQGQSIDEVLIAGVKGAVPGGPLAAAAFEAAVGIAQGKNVGQVALSQVGNVLGAVGVPVPPQVSDVMGAGVNVAQDLVAGKPLDAAVLNRAVAALGPEATQLVQEAEAAGNISKVADLLIEHGAAMIPNLSDAEKDALQKAMGVGIAMGTAQRVKASTWSPDGKLDAAAMRAQLEAALLTQKYDAVDLIDAKLTPKQLDKKYPTFMGTAMSEPQKFLETTIKNFEFTRPGKHLGPPPLIVTKLQEVIDWAGPQMAVADGKATAFQKLAVVNANKRNNAARLAAVKSGAAVKKAPTAIIMPETPSAHGAALAEMLLHKHFSKAEFVALRAHLSEEERHGFDLAISNAIGQRMKSAPSNLTADEKEAYYIVKGMQGAPVDSRVAMMNSVAATHAGANGAIVAVQEVATARAGIWERILSFLHLR